MFLNKNISSAYLQSNKKTFILHVKFKEKHKCEKKTTEIILFLKVLLLPFKEFIDF